MTALDLCLREGCDDPNVAWEAAIQANSNGQFEAVLTYLDRLESWVGPQPWNNYYRSLALQELGRPAEAIEALDREIELNPEAEFGVLIQRASALALLRQIDEMRVCLQAVLDRPLWKVENLSRVGQSQLHRRLWRSVEQALPASDPMRLQLEQKLLDSCLAPDEMFEAIRLGNEEGSEEVVRYYEVVLKQPLDAAWDSFHGRLMEEQDWSEFTIVWRMLAKDDDHASAIALEWQHKSFAEPASVEFVGASDQEYTDRPGVVGFGPRLVPQSSSEA